MGRKFKGQWLKKETLKDRVLRNTRKTKGCWHWTGAFNAYGYGVLGYKMKKYMAHRASYQSFIGNIPAKLYVCHKCDNTKCVNPKHLFLGTQKDNMADCIRKGRFHKGIKLKPQDIQKIRKLKGKFLHREIGEMFGVSRSLIGDIYRGRLHKHD